MHTGVWCKPPCCAGGTDFALICITTVQGRNACIQQSVFCDFGSTPCWVGKRNWSPKTKRRVGQHFGNQTHVILGNGTWLLIALTYPFLIVIVLNICYFVDVSCQPDGNTYEGSMRNTSRCLNFFEDGKYQYLSRLKNFRNISNFSLRHVIF